MQGQGESRQHVVAHRRGGGEARLTRNGIQELDAFSSNETRGLAGTGCGGVSMAGGRGGQGARKGEGPSLAITAMVCLEFAYVFWLFVSMRKVASGHPFCVLIHMNSHIFHICFILFIFLYNISNI